MRNLNYFITLFYPKNNIYVYTYIFHVSNKFRYVNINITLYVKC